MDLPFDPKDLHPTRPPPEPTDALPATPSTEETATAASRVARETQDTARHPYDPDGWLSRSGLLERLGYPELAASDAWKADHLCDSMLTFVACTRGKVWRMGAHKGFWMLDGDITPNELEVETVRLCETLSELKDEAWAAQTRNLHYFPSYMEGRHLPQVYPWLEQRHRIRSDELLAEVNEEFCDNVVSTNDDKPYCEVRRCTFGPDTTGEPDQAGSLGIFATRNISKSTRILTDRSELFGCIGAGNNDDRSNLHGSSGCTNPLHPNAPSDDVSLDLRWVRERHGSRASEVLLLCRVLLECVRDDFKHPLDLSEIARITPTYHRKRPKTFWLEDQIVTPNEALERFGVDIYASPQYDCWVLFTVIARMDNNSWSNPICAVLNSLFCVFNHSCEPNVTWKTRQDHLTIDLAAKRDIAKGEQMFVEYDGYVHDKTLAERRKRLGRWIDGPCLCTRCLKEHAEMDEKMAASACDVTSSDSDGQGDGQGGRPKWDDSVPPTLPPGGNW